MFIPFLGATLIAAGAVKLGALQATNSFLGFGVNLALIVIAVLAIALYRSRNQKS